MTDRFAGNINSHHLWIIRQDTDRALNGIVASAMLKPSLRHSGARSWGKPPQAGKVSEVRQCSRRFSLQRKKVIDGIVQILVSKSEMDKGWMKWMKMDKMDAMDSGQYKTGTQKPGCYRF